MHVHKSACNLYVKIYGAYEMYVKVTYANNLFVNFAWLIYLYLYILLYRLHKLFIHKYINIIH